MMVLRNASLPGVFQVHLLLNGIKASKKLSITNGNVRQELLEFQYTNRVEKVTVFTEKGQ